MIIIIFYNNYNDYFLITNLIAIRHHTRASLFFSYVLLFTLLISRYT